MHKFSSAKKFFSAVTLLSTIILLSGCSLPEGLSPLPDEQRYQLINEVVSQVDVDTTGLVQQDFYDNGDGVFGPSFYWANIRGEETYTILSERLNELPNIECQDSNQIQYICDYGQVTIAVHKDNVLDPMTTIKITDMYSGRDPND